MILFVGNIIAQIAISVISGVASAIVTSKIINESNQKKVYARLISDLKKKLSFLYADLNKHHCRYVEEEKSWKSNPNQGINPSSALEKPYLNLDLESIDESIIGLSEFDNSDEIMDIARRASAYLYEVYNSFVYGVDNNRSRHYYFQKRNDEIVADRNQNLLDACMELISKI